MTSNERKYLPTLAELIDRLSIVQLKEIFDADHRDAYRAERKDIMHDIDLLLKQQLPLDANDVHAILVIMLTNRVIWESESRARQGGSEQDKFLKFTHSINGVRNTAKNALIHWKGQRHDFKVDCLAADLAPEFGIWDIFKG